jgi:aryl-alcohol dehydrogenase-like predicted oxidoreductase
MLGHVAVGTWSGGRFMRFGEPISDERLEALLRPGNGIDTVLTADTYGAGEADVLLGRALAGVPRDRYSLAGAVGHDFYEGERDGAKGFPRFTDPRLRGPDGYRDYLRMAVERSLERCGVDSFDLLLLHNPDRRGFESPEVWEALRELRDDGLANALGLAPGPANGFTLDVIGCFERYGEAIDWAMLILNPFEPWPGELALDAAASHGVKVITRVVDYGGLFHDDVLPGHGFEPHDHRGFRPDGWVEAGRARLERIRPIADRHGLTPLQLACVWNLAHEAVECVASGRQADRAQARGAGGGARGAAPDQRGGRRDPDDRRQPRLDAAEGCDTRPRRRRAPRPLAAQPRAGAAGDALGHRPRARSC